MRRRLLAAILSVSSLSSACMWDTDTLAEEASFGKDFVATITGRFARNPPLYDEMRRDRLLAKRRKTSVDYDDLAVAYERLGDSLTALRWIERKPHGTSMDEYRTHANRGTFLVHAWLRGKLGRDAGERGVRELEKAVALNPEAHFGRERVQIELVKAFLRPHDGSFVASETPLKDAEGYAGIVRLGSGWESPDVFRMLAVDLAGSREARPKLGAVATLALLRADEIEATGGRARLSKRDYFPDVEGRQTPDLLGDTRAEFVRLRTEADAWEARRTAFMMGRLRAGRHPDTDPRFWKGWIDRPPPRVGGALLLNVMGIRVSPYVLAALGFTLVALLVASWLAIRWIGRSWRRFE